MTAWRRSIAISFVLLTTLLVPATAHAAPLGIITVAGIGTTGDSGDGGQATAAQLNRPTRITLDDSGNLYISDWMNHRVRKVDHLGVITTIAGNGTDGYSGDGGPATSAQLDSPLGLAVDGDGNIYIADSGNHVVRMVDSNGDITTIAGTGTQGSAGEGGPATSAQLSNPAGLAFDANGNLHIADTSNHAVRMIDSEGDISTVAGTFGSAGLSGDGAAATSAEMDGPQAIAFHPVTGELFITDSNNDRVRMVDSGGDIDTVAGPFGTPFMYGIEVDPAGNVYVSVTGDHEVVRLAAGSYAVTTVAGTGSNLASINDGGPATSAGLFNPSGLALDDDGFLYIADTFHDRVRRVDPAVTRYGGDNRYGTARLTSIGSYPTASTVYIATGANYPDAVAGAAIAGREGAPLLLVSPTGVPTETIAELERLQPDTIVILGGEAVISPAVATTLSGYASGVIRLSGGNRYETAVEISKHGFPADGSADQVVIATGLGFADALAGAPLAVSGNGPVLLTPPDSLPAVVADEITRLAPSSIRVLGGPAAVSDAVLAQLTSLQADTERYAGDNRYETAVEIAIQTFFGADRVYVATGLNFPDALAGAAVAAADGAPVYLVPGTSIPTIVLDDIGRLGASEAVILGGTAVVTTSVETALRASLAL